MTLCAMGRGVGLWVAAACVGWFALLGQFKLEGSASLLNELN
jgi:hypothetical protein